MKKLIMAIAVLGAFTVSAQRHGEGKISKDLSAEQIATLRTKKMTLALALDDKQSDKVYTVLLDQAKDRKAMITNRKSKEEKPELTKEERFAKTNERLDKRIAVQNEMKAILTDSQFEQYKKMNSKHRKGNKKKGRHARK